MRSGKLVHVIEIQSAIETVTATSTWQSFASLRAELVERSTEEFLRNAGETSETTIVFRTRFVAGIRDQYRVSFDGSTYGIEELVTIGRRKGLEIRCKEIKP